MYTIITEDYFGLLVYFFLGRKFAMMLVFDEIVLFHNYSSTNVLLFVRKHTNIRFANEVSGHIGDYFIKNVLHRKGKSTFTLRERVFIFVWNRVRTRRKEKRH